MPSLRTSCVYAACGALRPDLRGSSGSGPFTKIACAGPSRRRSGYSITITGRRVSNGAYRGGSVIGAYDFTDHHYGGPSGQANSIQFSIVYEPHRPAEGPAITVGC